jgi:hypothetical protein
LVGRVVMTFVIVFQLSLGFKHGGQAVEPETLVQGELDQIDFVA